MYLQILLLLIEFVLENFAVHHVLKLVHQVAAHVLMGSRATNLILLIRKQVKILISVGREGIGQHDGVGDSLLHGVDVRVHVKLDRELVDFGFAGDSGDCGKNQDNVRICGYKNKTNN